MKVTYKNLTTWYSELRQYRPDIPTLLGANKIDENMEVSHKPIAMICLSGHHQELCLRRQE